MIKSFYNKIYTVPSLFMHELSHILIAYLLGGKLTKVDIKNSEKGCSVILKFVNLKNLTFVRLVALSPFFVPIIFISLSFINTNFIYAVFYSVTTYKITIPSSTDFKTGRFNM